MAFGVDRRPVDSHVARELSHALNDASLIVSGEIRVDDGECTIDCFAAVGAPIRRSSGFLVARETIPLMKCELHLHGVDAVSIDDDQGIEEYTIQNLEYVKETGVLRLSTNEKLSLVFRPSTASASGLESELTVTDRMVGQVVRTLYFRRFESEKVERMDNRNKP